MRTKSPILLSLLGLVLSACSSSAPPAANGPATVPPEILMLGTANGPMTVEVPAGSVLFRRDGALVSPDGRRVYSVSLTGERSVLETADAVSGESLSTVSVEGPHDLSVVSASGGAAALVDPLPKGWEPGVPVPRARTTIVIADPTGQREPLTFDLEGNYEPEAFSTDDSKLFLIQHLPAEAPTVYRVTMLDLKMRDVFPVFGPYKGAPERMPGTRLEQVLAPDTNRLYTLYSSTQPGYAPHNAPVAHNAAVSFVHVLDLHEGWAHCVGLPKQLWDRPASEQAMAVSPDGATLYVVDPARGVVAAMDTGSLETRVATNVAFGAVTDEDASVQVSADGSTLFVVAGGPTSTLFALDAQTFDVVHRAELDGAISSIGLSADGARLYAATGSGLSVLDPMTGDALADVPLAAAAAVFRVSPLAA